MARPMVHEVTYPHPPERVWRALTEPAALGDWLMKTDHQPKVGHRFEFRAEPMMGWDGVVRCEVLEADPPRRLVWSWWGGGKNPRTTVTWTLSPVPGGTKLRLEHTGLAGFQGFLMRMFMDNGWGRKMLRGSLPRLLDRWAQAPQAR